MPIFKCTDCGAVENTALGDYWNAEVDGRPPRCSLCGLGKWHDRFPRTTPEAEGYIEAQDGFWYVPADLAPGGYFHGRVKPKDTP